jgi:hypothetical protein
MDREMDDSLACAILTFFRSGRGSEGAIQKSGALDVILITQTNNPPTFV